MRLFITDKPDDGRLDCQYISIDNFNDLCYHPYIQSIKWESVIVDLDDRIKRSYIKQIIGRNTKVVPRVLRGSVTPKGLLLLAEIYPDDMAEIYSWSKLPFNEMVEKVNELAEKKHWSTEY